MQTSSPEGKCDWSYFPILSPAWCIEFIGVCFRQRIISSRWHLGSIPATDSGKWACTPGTKAGPDRAVESSLGDISSTFPSFNKYPWFTFQSWHSLWRALAAACIHQSAGGIRWPSRSVWQWLGDTRLGIIWGQLVACLPWRCCLVLGSVLGILHTYHLYALCIPSPSLRVTFTVWRVPLKAIWEN